MPQVTKAYVTEPFWVQTPDIQSSRLTPSLKKNRQASSSRSTSYDHARILSQDGEIG